MEVIKTIVGKHVEHLFIDNVAFKLLSFWGRPKPRKGNMRTEWGFTKLCKAVGSSADGNFASTGTRKIFGMMT